MGQPQVNKWVEAVNYSIHKLINVTMSIGPLVRFGVGDNDYTKIIHSMQ